MLLRPIGKEMGSIKWRDVRIVKSKDVKRAYIAVVTIKSGKKGTPRFAVSTYKGTLFIQRWRKHCKRYGFGKDSDFMFPNHQGEQSTAWHMGTQLRNLLNKHGVRKQSDGSNISLYSWRASGITNRLIYSKWNIERVALAADTSIKTISESYYNEVQTQNPDRFANQFSGQVYWSSRDANELSELASYLKKFN